MGITGLEGSLQVKGGGGETYYFNPCLQLKRSPPPIHLSGNQSWDNWISNPALNPTEILGLLSQSTKKCRTQPHNLLMICPKLLSFNLRTLQFSGINIGLKARCSLGSIPPAGIDLRTTRSATQSLNPLNY